MDLFEYQGKQYFARYDIPVSPGDIAEGKNIGWKDAFSAVWTLLKYRFVE